MGQPSWREIKKVKVPGGEKSLWTPALDYITLNKLYRISVEPIIDPNQPNANPPVMVAQHWTPESGSKCTADGDVKLSRSGGLVIDGVAPGALIAKVGGGTADLKPDATKTVLFSVGRHCVFSVSEPAKLGALYLGMNDAPGTTASVDGELEVTISESL
jgi:hypothetical protein